ncbi:hypothetical protein [Rufibacter quisquiliarum]|uniref:Glycosyl-4,4'-diaponeurosporenoate acyltransferase n=1 Tax=Rufibacter quisquiliarum TaxID=1549639 RepID=A0A839GEM1_9BACT|nr:hypothetical protein [Rufibacter quisquiliarum]MBA9076910.1 hypothetical protein [Rufibacter quisquiliarum]
MTTNAKSWGISIFATIVTIVLCLVFTRVFKVESFVFSWGLNFLLMGWYTVVITLLKPDLDWSYFQQKTFEKEGRWYKYLGLHLYRKLLVAVGWEKISKQNNPVKKEPACLQTCERNTRISELGHLIIAVIVFAIAVFFTSSVTESKWLIILNVLLNIYPILLQRYNRPRYRKILQRMEARQHDQELERLLK